MPRAPVKQRSVGQRLIETITGRVAQGALDFDSAIQNLVSHINERGQPKPMLQQFGPPLNQPTTDPRASGAKQTLAPLPSGAGYARSYRETLESEAYKRLPEPHRRKFRQGSMADIARYKDVI